MKLTIRSSYALTLWCSVVAISGCSDGVDNGTNFREEVNTIVCSDAAFPHDEHYHLDVMNETLANQPQVIEATGVEVVTSCEEARAVGRARDELLEVDAEDVDTTDSDALPASEELEEKIWRGTSTYRQHHVWISSVGCSGVFINTRTILTAAHCLPRNAASIGVGGDLIGCTVVPASTGVPVSSTSCRVWHHGDYDGASDGGDDIGIIQLPSAKAVSGVGQRIYTGDLDQYERLDAAGYGVTGIGLNNYGTLREDPDGDDIPVDARMDKQINSYAREGVARECSGDSGSPLLKNGFGYDLVVALFSNMEIVSECAGVNCCTMHDGRMEFPRLRHKMTKQSADTISWVEDRIGSCNVYQSGQYKRCF